MTLVLDSGTLLTVALLCYLWGAVRHVLLDWKRDALSDWPLDALGALALGFGVFAYLLFQARAFVPLAVVCVLTFLAGGGLLAKVRDRWHNTRRRR